MNRAFKTAKGTELPLLNLRGKEYLEVKYRLVWFREEHPDWSIETEFLEITDQSATAKAIVRDGQGRVISTGHKFETKQGFPDFMEKAETGAIGRALALVGFGTQFCADELDEGERIVDAPVSPSASYAGAPQDVLESEPPTPGLTRGKGVPAELGDYVIPFGKKYKGKRLREVPRDEIQSYLSWLESDAAKKNTPLSHEVKMLKYAVERYYEGASEEGKGKATKSA